MSDTIFNMVTLVGMTIVGIAWLAWPSKVQQVAIRYSEKSALTRFGAPIVRSDAYVGMVRMLGGFLLLLVVIV
jgi:hypothetical protein